MENELLKQLGFSDKFIERIQNSPNYQYYEQPRADFNSIIIEPFPKPSTNEL